MIDLGFAALLALISAGFGKRILDGLHESPEHPLDAIALALPLGMGLTALATLALAEVGWLNFVGLSVLLAVLVELGIVAWFNLFREVRAWFRKRVRTRSRTSLSLFFAICLGLVIAGTALTALTPVTDGDALCYHLQVPKVFLMRGSVGFWPDLHETVYPLVTEMLYAVALAFRGPVACRGIQWVLGLVFAANVTALARPSLGRRAWWAGAIAISVPAVTNGMSAPLNDVALAAFGTAALFAWVRLHERPTIRAAIVAGLLSGLAIGVKYPALVLCGLLAPTIALRAIDRRSPNAGGARPPWFSLTAIYLATTAAVGGWWYLRAYVHTGNPVYPFFRHVFGGAGLDQVLDPIKRPLAVTPFNLLTSLVPLSLHPEQFDSFSHQFGPVFLLFLPAIFLFRVPRRVLALVGLAYAFLIVCLTQRQSMRFLLIALGPMSIGVAYLAGIWCKRRTVPARTLIAILVATMGLEASVAVARARHAVSVLLGHESAADFLTRREPTFAVGRWAASNLPTTARLIGQDHRGFYIPRDYTMELAHRRRTGLGGHGETSREIVAKLRESGFTHILFCPPVPETAVEFDPTLSRLLEPWVAERTPLFRQDLSDGDGVLRQYAIYELNPAAPSPDPQPMDQLSTRSNEVLAR
jgi:Dolichyl-phosphate-mannose-protein mannosyltransferase